VSETELYRALLAGPDEKTVFLGPGVQPQQLARYAAGLANARGGVILLGVVNGRVADASGLEPLQLGHAVYQLSGGDLLVHVERIDASEGVVWALHVPKSPFVVAVGQGAAPYWNGRELTTLPASQEILSADPSAKVLAGTSLRDLDPQAMQTIRERLRGRGSPLAETSDLEMAQALGMVKESQGETLPTVSGLLLAGSSAALARSLPQAEVSYYRHEEDEVDYSFREDMVKPIPAALARLHELIQARNNFQALHVGLFRLEVWDFDVEVYREALLNAFVHRDWTSTSTIQVHHHPDRLEISNPGGLAPGMTPQNILRHPPQRRNPALAGALAQLGYVERAGLGVDKMYRLMLRYGKEPPEYRSWQAAVTLLLHNPGFDADFVRWVSQAQNEQGAFTLDYLIVLAALRRAAQATSDLARALQLPLPATRKLLAKMQQAGLVLPQGRGRGRLWRLAQGGGE